MRIVNLVYYVLGSTFFMACLAHAQEPQKDLADQIRASKALLAQKCADPRMWTDNEFARELTKSLELAREIPDVAYAKVLVAHITFCPNGSTEKLRTLANTFPVFGVLKAIGTPAVPSLLSRLKQIDAALPQPEGKMSEEDRVRWVLKFGDKIREDGLAQ